MNIKRFMSKKVIAIGLAAGITLGLGGAAFAFFTTTGSGNGSASVGTDTALTVQQDGIVYSNSGTDNALMPGTFATISLGVNNTSSGHEQLGTVSVTSIHACPAGSHWYPALSPSGSGPGCSTDGSLTNLKTEVTGCEDFATSGAADDFTIPTVAENQDVAGGATNTAVTNPVVVTMNDLNSNQNICKSVNLYFVFAA